MPFEMECARDVVKRYWSSPAHVRAAFDRAVAAILKDWTRGSPDLGRSKQPANKRRYRFAFGIITYRYVYDEAADPRIKVLDWQTLR